MTFTQNPQHVPLYGVFEFLLKTEANKQLPIFETDFTVVFARPDGTTVTAEGFYDGGGT